VESDDRSSIKATATISQVDDGSVGVERFHADLHRIARRELKRMARSGTIDTVALVSEAYLRVESADRQWESRAHFLASMTTVMRHVLVDYARERSALRRGGDWVQLTGSSLDELQGEACPLDVLALDTAMHELGQLSPRLERVVELKIFGGLTIDEIAQALEISTSTVSREMRIASAFLRRALTAD
jgi:RNA polymerase sigma factor (TIGR02999 family)